MKYLLNIALIFLFLFQGADESSFLVALVLSILLIALTHNGALPKFPSYYLIAVCIYLFYLSLGLLNHHPNAQIDIKFQVFSFAFYFWLINNHSKVNFLKLLFIINSTVLIIYFLLYFDVIPNFWNEQTFGRQGRILGPAITPMVYILFLYLQHNKKFDFRLGVALLGSMVYLLMTSNFMNVSIVLILSLLTVINFRQLLKPIYMAGVLVLGISIIFYIKSPYVPEMIASKLEYVFKPWEYGTVKTRISDLNQALQNENFDTFKKLFGEGFGTSSEIYRENKIAPSLSRTFSFQEIDNGFYYIYHRGGWSLLSLFFLSHIYLISRIHGFKTKIGFFVIVIITNLLSIHYFNHIFYLLIPFWVLHRRNS